MEIQPAAAGALMYAYLSQKAIDSAVPIEMMKVAFEEIDQYRNYFAEVPSMPVRFEKYA